MLAGTVISYYMPSRASKPSNSEMSLQQARRPREGMKGSTKESLSWRKWQHSLPCAEHRRTSPVMAKGAKNRTNRTRGRTFPLPNVKPSLKPGQAIAGSLCTNKDRQPTIVLPRTRRLPLTNKSLQTNITQHHLCTEPVPACRHSNAKTRI